MNIMQLFQQRRSIREYTGEHISEDSIRTILQAGMLAPSSRALYPVEFLVVRDRNMLQSLSRSKASGSDMLKQADAAIVVIGDAEKADAWIEDCSLAMIYMHLAASALGLGSCWIQCRGRFSRQLREPVSTDSPEYLTANEYLHELLKIPARFQVEAILSLGVPAQELPSRELPDPESGKVHYEVY